LLTVSQLETQLTMAKIADVDWIIEALWLDIKN
jgi:3-hydroxyacyl-CoA dehydrogenase